MVNDSIAFANDRGSIAAARISGKLPENRNRAANVLNGAVGFWFVVTVIGQLIFAFSTAIFYGLTAFRGEWHRWNRSMTHGYVQGDAPGNLVVSLHLATAVVIILSGAIQLVPEVRRRVPRLHRWTGRLYLVSALGIALSGPWLMWVRGTVGTFTQHVGTSLLAVLILIFGAMAFRTARRRDFASHRRWALRLYITVSASLVIRIVPVLWAAIFGSPFGFDPTLAGPFFTVLSFGQYLGPLAILEGYLWVQKNGGAAARIAMATGLTMLTIGTGLGIAGFTASGWLPNVKVALDQRKSIVGVVADTIAAHGMDEAIAQYHRLRESSPASYNFAEGELNSLGYEYIRAGQYATAIRVFRLNVEAYPKSANVYDSLGEAYMDNGEREPASANYRKSLELNPKNAGAVQRLEQLSRR